MDKKTSKAKNNIIRDKIEAPSSFVQRMFDHGLKMEAIIADKYVTVQVFDSGLVINENNLWLAASPDKKVVDMTEKNPFGLLEMKAPAHTMYINVTSLEACNSPTFYLENVNGFPKLKNNHGNGYFEQVQGQMVLTGANWCDFVVCTKKGMSVERIRFDQSFWLDKVQCLEEFFFKHFLPALLGKHED
ncbi:uncharacterized protein LOC144349052 [Saccoglossus kowalevskii]